MKPIFICIKFKDKNNINNNKILEIFDLSAGNDLFNLKVSNKNTLFQIEKKQSSNHDLEIIYNKTIIKKNIAKMIYKATENIKKIKILNEVFILNNVKRANIIINNKQSALKEKIEIQKNTIYKIKIKFLDNVIKVNSMFKDCESLSSVHYLQYLNTKYLKSIDNLFYGCISLIFINDITNWNIKNINDISGIFLQCSSLKSLPDISKWDTSNIINMSLLFYGCSSLKLLPDISKWNLSNVKDIIGMFDSCSSLEEIPDISKWNTNQIKNM